MGPVRADVFVDGRMSLELTIGDRPHISVETMGTRRPAVLGGYWDQFGKLKIEGEGGDEVLLLRFHVDLEQGRFPSLIRKSRVTHLRLTFLFAIAWIYRSTSIL